MTDIPEDIMQMWLEQCCCCPECNQVPCGGVVQGALCLAMPCRRDDDEYFYEDDELECIE